MVLLLSPLPDALPDVATLRRQFAAGELSVPHLLRTIRAWRDSVRAGERADAVRLLGSVPHVDAARELMSIYRECPWRDTRLLAVRELGRHPFQRSVEFLIGLVAERADLPVAEEAVRALGRTRHPLAAAYLVALYRSGADALRPAVAGALAAIPTRALVPELVADLARALRADERLYARQLLLTLADLQAPAALPLALAQLGEATDPGLRSCALVAVGKLGRSPADLDGIDGYTDPLEQQLLLAARSQVAARARTSIEDLAVRLFARGESALVGELGMFPPDDVAAAVELFLDPEHVRAVTAALAGLDHPDRYTWLDTLAAIEGLTDAEIEGLLACLSTRTDARALPVLRRLEATCLADPSGRLFGRWFEAVSLALPRADAEIHRHLTDPSWPDLPAHARVDILNHLVNHALATSPDPRGPRRVAVMLEQALFAEQDPRVQGRLLRGLGQLGICGARVVAWIGEHKARPDLLASGLQLLESATPKGATELLLGCLRDPLLTTRHAAALLRALRTQPPEPLRDLTGRDAAALDALLALGLDAGPDERIAALRCLAAHPRRAHLSAVTTQLTGEERYQLPAIVALKALGHPDSADDLAPLLASPSESVVGRAVDALTALPGIKAAKLLVGVLRAHPDNTELCDKILRSMTPPAGARDELVRALDQLLTERGGHPFAEGLYALRERMAPPSPGGGARSADVPRIDAALAERIRGYAALDDQVKGALRAAELPFYRPELYQGPLDKSTAVLGYCKALDLHLEGALGQRMLFPGLAHRLYAFQERVHAAGLADEVPATARVVEFFQLGGTFRAVGSPIPKMSAVGQGVLSGRILLGEQGRVLDGLRAWAAVMLLFGMDLPPGGPRGSGARALLPLRGGHGEVLRVAERLFALQNLRNPVAHRQLVLGFPEIQRARDEAGALFDALGVLLG